MRQQLLRTFVACAAGLVLGSQAQTSSSPGGSPTDPPSSSGTTYPGAPTSSGAYGNSSSGQAGWPGRHLSAIGRMGHEAVRGSQLTGAQVAALSGSEIGTISDTIINPAAGRLEFAVISLNGTPAGANTSTPDSASTSSTGISSPGLSSAGKKVVVPWMLLRSSSAGAATSSVANSPGMSLQQPSFVFVGDTSKLQAAPTFDVSTDFNHPTWRQSVLSYFGLSGGSSAIGGAETPGGSSSGSATSQNPPRNP
jgi:sporulation protein YlmC with PRC-barrel domain